MNTSGQAWRTRLAILLAAVSLFSPSPRAHAQPEQPATPPSSPPTKPATDPGEDETERMRRRTTTAEDGLKPADQRPPTPAAPPAPAAGPKKPKPETGIPVPRARRAREGVFVVKQRGELLVARTGDVVFVPDQDAPARTSRPMVILPCQTMSRLEAAAGLKTDSPTAEGAPRPRVLLTGQIMVYRQREYILPSIFQVEPPASESTAAAESTPEAAPGAAPREIDAGDADDRAPKSGPAEKPQDKEVEAFIRELEDRRTKNRGISREMARETTQPAAKPSPAPAPGASDPTNPAATPSAEPEKSWAAPEGSVITARRGRLVRFADGGVGISFDNGVVPPGTSRRAEAPMALHPCQLTQRMEEVVGARGDKAAIEISGRVFTYGTRNYLLPTMYQVLPPTDVGPLN